MPAARPACWAWVAWWSGLLYYILTRRRRALGGTWCGRALCGLHGGDSHSAHGRVISTRGERRTGLHIPRPRVRILDGNTGGGGAWRERENGRDGTWVGSVAN
jgi:hypothetical protein